MSKVEQRRSKVSPQTTDTVLMIRPAVFGVNVQTAASNEYQEAPTSAGADLCARAVAEFDAVVAALRSGGVRVLVMDDTPDPPKPDAVFPNNWITTHEDGSVVFYPMEALNRRIERRGDVVPFLEAAGFQVNRVVDYSVWEGRGAYLEGTGSMVLDRPGRRCYAAISSRTHETLLGRFCSDFGYEPVTFHAMGRRGPIYHTNVMLAIGAGVAVVGLDTVPDAGERENLRRHLESGGRTVICMTNDQVHDFACNVLELCGRDGPVLVLSRRALDVLDDQQRRLLAAAATLLPVSIPTLECGGGSVRCTLAEVFLPPA
ncbi:MAG: amidinotransferase [Phycisphaerales bacterium]|nr:MAG: amidinotransferase [Phycisphaerales bacterium]